MTHDDSNPEPTHLNNKHTDTLAALFAHPVGHNIRWEDVVSLVGAVGDVDEEHNGRVKFTIGGEPAWFHRPNHGSDIDVQQVQDVRKMLSAAGFEPPKPGKEV